MVQYYNTRNNHVERMKEQRHKNNAALQQLSDSIKRGTGKTNLSTYNQIRINIGDHDKRWLSYRTSVDLLNIQKTTTFSNPCLFLAFIEFSTLQCLSQSITMLFMFISVNNHGVHAQLVITARLSTDFCRQLLFTFSMYKIK